MTRFEVVFALEPLLHDVHVQQAEEAAAKAEAQRGGDFRLVVQRRVVELELGERIAKALVVLGIDREQAGEHARLDLLEAGQRRGAGARLERDGVADRCAVDLPDAGDDEADLAGAQGLERESTWA